MLDNTQDPLKKIIQTDLIESTGLDQLIKLPTHRPLQNGRLGKESLIYQVFTNMKYKVTQTFLDSHYGTHHKRIEVQIKDRVAYQGPN